MTQELAIRDTNKTPALVIEEAREQAKALMDIVESRHLYLVIGDKKHLYVEAWETIGAFNRSKAVPDSDIKVIIEDNQIVGYEARITLYKDGAIDGGGIGECRLSEAVCRNNKNQLLPNAHSACKSMAQTRATSKAYRINYSWVAVLAGYNPTPAEEMMQTIVDIDDNAAEAQTGDNDNPLEFCWVHRFADGNPKKWYVNQYQGQERRGHKEGEGFCNLVDLIKPQWEGLVSQAPWDKKSIDGNLAKKFGATFSKLDEPKKLEAIRWLQGAIEKAQGGGSQAPIKVEEAPEDVEF